VCANGFLAKNGIKTHKQVIWLHKELNIVHNLMFFNQNKPLFAVVDQLKCLFLQQQ